MSEGYNLVKEYITGTMDISGAATVEVIFPRHFRLMEIRVFVSVVTATADETMTARRRPVAGQTTPTPIDIGTFVVASGLAVGSEVRVSTATIADTEFNPGESLAITCGNSTGTGTVYFGIIGYHYDGDNWNPQTAFDTQPATAKTISGGAGTISYKAMTAT